MTVLGSREHTCIHPEVSRMKAKNDGCKDLLNGPGCRFKDGTPRLMSQNIVKSIGLGSAWDIEDLVQLCQKRKACPYFLARGLKEEADLIICPYNYLIDPIIREAMAINLKGHIVILDEAHNIEDAAREAASQSISQDNIAKALKDIDMLIEKNINFADNSRLRAVFHKLDRFIDENKTKLEQKDFEKAYKIWSAFEIVAQLDSLGLGPKHFPDLKSAFAAVKAEAEQRKEEALKTSFNVELLEMKPATEGLLTQIFQVLEYLYRSDLKYVDDYRASLVQSYEYVFTNENQWLNSKNGHNRSRNTTVTYMLNFWCMNPGVAFSDFSETRSIILTSGTLSPLTSFQSELGLNFSIQLEANHVIKDSQVWVGTIGSGPSGSKLQAVFRNLETFAFQDELGGLVLRVCEIVPHGVLCFLSSYKVLEKLINRWENIGLLKKLAHKKKIIVEPRGSDKVDFEEQMVNFYETMRSNNSDNACEENGDSLTGAVFFAVCRGKVSEGLDFADNFARAVITVGIPYPNYKDVQVEQKRQYNESHKNSRGLLGGHQWYEIQAFRALNQALGRCIRHRNDWGALIIVDERFIRDPQKYCTALSKWVRTKIQAHQNFSIAMGSLSQFIAARSIADNEMGAATNAMESSELTSPMQANPVYQLKTNSKQALASSTQSALQSPDDKSNFPIFNSVKTPSTSRKYHPDAGDMECISLNGAAHNASANKVSGGGFFTPSKKLAHLVSKLQSPMNSRGAGISKEEPIIVESDPSEPVATVTMDHFAVNTTVEGGLQSKIAHNILTDRQETPVAVTPTYILEETSDATCRAQLKIITERAVNGESAKVVEIPPRLRFLFGGNLRLPLSSKQSLVYLVEAPACAGQRPTAKIIKMAEEDRQNLMEKAIAAEKAQSEDNLFSCDGSPVLPEQGSTFISEIRDHTINSTVLHSPPHLETIESPHINKDTSSYPRPPTTCTSSVKSFNKMNSLSSDKSGSSLRVTEDIHNTSPDSDNALHRPVSPSFSSCITRNKRRLFKPRGIPDEHKDNAQEVDLSLTTIQTPPRSIAAGETELQTPTPVALSSFLEDPDGDNFEEEKIVIRRKTKKRKISLRHSNKKKQKEETVSNVDRNTSMSFRCSACSHLLIHDKTPDSYHQQTLPAFLKDFQKTTCINPSCFFFPKTTNTEGLVTQASSSPGVSTKYIEQEEICVQLLYCGHCWAQSPETADYIGARVQLAAGAGARFSKGQIWLFHQSVHLGYHASEDTRSCSR
ncbi:Fanconi anemia group J protein [Bulinus truncatus]|nr:Fanconi anemia group J protein [Bulinus truncatus]